MNIEKLDANFAAASTLGLDNLKYYDVRQKPFQLYGFYEPLTQPWFVRMDPEVAAKITLGVSQLNENTAGGRVRFTTDSDYVAIRSVMRHFTNMPHMAMVGIRGFDIYEELDGRSVYRGTYQPTVRPAADRTASFEGVVKFPDRKMRSFTVNFPLYHDVKDLYIGVRADAALSEGKSYGRPGKILYYGSSITQGGCASRPGTCYQNHIARRFDMDYHNLGFSGNAKGEDLMVEYLTKQDCTVFVMDYDHNAETVEHLKNTHWKLYAAMRKAHPDLPIIMVGRPDGWGDDVRYADSCKRREVILATFTRAVANGDKLVRFIDGEALLAGLPRMECFVDGTHPTDLGFYGMANVIGNEIARFL